MNKLPIGMVLKNKGLINDKQLTHALAVQVQKKDKRLGEILIELGYVTEADFLSVLAERLNVNFLNTDTLNAGREAVCLIPESLARKHKVVPLDIIDGILNVATSDPLDMMALDDVRMKTGMPCVPCLATKRSIENAIDRYYSEQSVKAMADTMKIESPMLKQQSAEIEELEDRIDNTPVVKIINTIIYQAIVRGASDIHIEPKKDKVLVRMRVDGGLVDYMTLSASAKSSLITRIKILSDLNIAEKRIPQDGRFNYNYGTGNIDIRVSVLPCVNGEKIVLRLLASSTKVRTLRELGMAEYNLEMFSRMIKAPNGIILVTGPTGSGKTTTLYSVLHDLAKPSVNVTTVEDPVEIALDTATQVQINPKAGLTFSAGLRSILRQDPDVVMVGEIRDQETASIAMRAAITGHLVLSTLHTNDSISTIMRLVDMGVESYLVASSLVGIVAQRLVKLICPHCKKPIQTSSADRAMLGSDVEHVYVGAGCSHCNGTGYVGRSAIHEVVLVDEKLREMIVKGATAEEMRDYTKIKGTRTLRDDVASMVVKGTTTMEELVRTTYSI